MADDPHGDAARRLGVELRRLRRERGLAQRDLRRALNLASHTAIVEFESGRRIPGWDILAAYERHFGLAQGTLGRMRQIALADRAAQEARQAMNTGGIAAVRPDQRVPRLLPGPTSHFTGRLAELELLDLHLRTESGVPVLMSAISGMGICWRISAPGWTLYPQATTRRAPSARYSPGPTTRSMRSSGRCSAYSGCMTALTSRFRRLPRWPAARSSGAVS